MLVTDATDNGFRELARRSHDCVEVVLFWHDRSGELTVCVSDERSGAYFELAAEPDRALDVFEHPFAYAAFRGVPYEHALLASWAHAAADSGPAIADLSEEPTR
jgi:hypothetical protein